MIDLDFETRSKADIKKIGAWAYALDPSTEITCMGVGTKAGVDVYTRQQIAKFGPEGGFPFDALCQISAHNAAFEYAIYNIILHRRYGWPARWDPKLWSCTMARAAMCGLPLDLDSLGRVLQIKTPKDLEGRRVMLQLSRPGKDGRYDEDPAKYEKLYAYNRTDVLAEMEVDALLPDLPSHERRIWEQDLVMNRRGFRVDLDLARGGAAMSQAIVSDLNARLFQLTGGAVSAASRIAEIKRYMIAHGVDVPTKFDPTKGEERETLDKVAILETMERPDLPPSVREALTIRAQVGKSISTAKYAKALEMVSKGERIRGGLQYHAAHTGRWGGRLLQPHNIPKGFKEKEQGPVVDAILRGDAAGFLAQHGVKAMDALSNALRGLIVASPGKVLVSADFNAIEARVLFWLAGALEPLAAYRRGESPYIDMAKDIYRRDDLSKFGTPQEYDIGKRTVLGAGFGMGSDKFQATVYLETMKATGVGVRISDELAETAIKMYRAKYPEVPRLWKEMEAAAISAVQNPTKVYSTAGGKVLWGMSKDGRFLVAKLPSGRHLRYYKPSVIDGWRIYCKDENCIHWKEFDEAKCPTRKAVKKLQYWGENPRTNQWGRLYPYGGLLVENVTQAVARDVMAHGLLNAEEAGFQALATIHDEILAEIEAGPHRLAEADLKHFIETMCRLPAWAEGLPVLAEGWVGPRYHK